MCFHKKVFIKSDAGEYFGADGSDCAQDFANVGTKKGDTSIPNTADAPPEPLQQRLFGE